MANKKKEYPKFLTPVFRVSFPSVFQPKAQGDSGKLKYSVSAVFRLVPNPKDPNDIVADPKGIEELKAAVRAAATEKWGADRAKWPKNLQSPLRKGEEKDYDGYGEGTIFCSLSSEYKPGLVDGQLQPILDPKDFYGGCYARAKVHAYAWEYMGKAGVSFSLWHLQKYADGKPFGGGGDASKEFDALPVSASAAASTTGAGAGAASAGDFGI